MSRETVVQTTCDRCGKCSVADDASLVIYGWIITEGSQVCSDCTDEALTAGFYFAEGIAAAIEAERLAQEHGWEQRAIAVQTIADWDEATQKWVMR